MKNTFDRYTGKQLGSVVAGGGGGGSGDVVGTPPSTDNALVRFDGITGLLLQNSTVFLDDSGNLTGLVSLSPATTEVGTLGEESTPLRFAELNLGGISSKTDMLSFYNSTHAQTQIFGFGGNGIFTCSGAANFRLDSQLLMRNNISSNYKGLHNIGATNEYGFGRIYINKPATDGGILGFDSGTCTLTCSDDGTTLALGGANFTNMTINGLLTPAAANLHDLGTTALAFRHIYLNNDATDGGAICFDADATKFLKADAGGTTLTMGGLTTLALGNSGTLTVGYWSMSTAGITIQSVGNKTLGGGIQHLWIKSDGTAGNSSIIFQETGETTDRSARGIHCHEGTNDDALDFLGTDYFRFFSDSSLGAEVLNNPTFTSGTNWAVTGDAALTSNQMRYTHSSGVGTVTQEDGDFDTALKADTWYLIQYRIGWCSGSLVTAVTDSASFTDVDYQYTHFSAGMTSITNDTHYMVVKTNSAPTDFKINITSTGGYWRLSQMSMKEITLGTIQTMKVKAEKGINTQFASSDASGTPTDALLDTAFGTPATVGAGFVGSYQDTNDSKIYLVTTDGTAWYYTTPVLAS